MGGTFADTLGGPMPPGSTDHLVAPRRSPIQNRRGAGAAPPPSGQSNMHGGNPTAEPPAPPASVQNIPVPSNGRHRSSASVGGSASHSSVVRASAPAQHAQHERSMNDREITVAPASAARRIPEEGARRGKREGSVKAGSVPLGAFLSALRKDESKVLLPLFVRSLFLAFRFQFAKERKILK